MDVLFQEMAPDKPDLLNGGLEDAVNAIPYRSGYGSFPEASTETGSLSATCVGAISCRDISGTVYRFAGTPERLYKLSGTTWSNVSRTASYTTNTDLRWRFAVFGNTLLAVNGLDTMQYWTLGTSTKFLDMSASASSPVAAHIITVRDFVMAGSIGTANKNRVQWSRINNASRWGSSVQYQADSQDLPGEGALVTGMTGGDFAAIFTFRSVWRASYVGSPLIFRFDEVAPGIGCPVPGSLARFQAMTYFWSGEGFYVFDGQQAVPIGDEIVDQFFYDDFASTYKYNVSSVIDPVNKLYMISYPSVNSSTGTCDRFLIINYTTGRWARVEHSIEFIYNALSAGYTLEGLDAIASSIESLSISLDSNAWQGGDPSLSAFSTSHVGVVFQGQPKTVTLTTGESNLVANYRALIRSIRPLVEGDSSTTVTTSIGKRDLLSDDVEWSGAVAMNRFGTCPHRSNARFQRLKMSIAGLPANKRAMGFDIDYIRHGGR